MTRSRLWLLAVLVAIAVVLSIAVAGPNTVPGDRAVALAIQGAVIPGGDRVAAWLNWLGGTFPSVAVMTGGAIALLVARGHRAEAAVVVAATVLRVASPLLKAVIASPRPTDELVRVIERVGGQGFPSGHALGAVLFYGTFGIIAPTVVRSRPAVRVARVCCVLLMLLAGWARVRTGAHWPSDVVGGFLWGAVLLLLLATVYERLRRGS